MDKKNKQFYSAFKNKSEIISNNWKQFIRKVLAGIVKQLKTH